MSAPSIRTAALAFALSSWVEGLTQIRTVLAMPYLPRGIPTTQLEQEPESTLPANTWKERILAWLQRSGREMDEDERMSLAIANVSTAFLIMQTLGQPLLPLLLSPLLTTLPLPRSTKGFKPIKWQYVVLATFVLSLVHETERVAVSLAVECVRKFRKTQHRRYLGEVYVRGHDHHPIEDMDEDDEEQDECLICAGVGADTSLSHSISSISSVPATSPMNALGPLEAFCTNAPQKHVAHRTCFLSWHAAYRQQRAHLPPEQVELQGCHSEADRMYAASILDAAGFGHLSRYLRLPHETPWPSLPPSLAHPMMSLSHNGAGRARGVSSACLATLRTTIPPCPGCRSSVLLHFFSRPALSHDATRRRARREIIILFARMWLQHWRALVTGRTILYRLASQWSFVMALLSMMRVSSKRVHWIYV